MTEKKKTKVEIVRPGNLEDVRVRVGDVVEVDAETMRALESLGMIAKKGGRP